MKKLLAVCLLVGSLAWWGNSQGLLNLSLPTPSPTPGVTTGIPELKGVAADQVAAYKQACRALAAKAAMDKEKALYLAPLYRSFAELVSRDSKASKSLGSLQVFRQAHASALKLHMARIDSAVTVGEEIDAVLVAAVGDKPVIITPELGTNLIIALVAIEQCLLEAAR